MGIHNYLFSCLVCKNKEAHRWRDGVVMEGGHCYECGYRWVLDMNTSEDYEDLVNLDEINHMNWNGKEEFSNLTSEEYEKRIKKYELEHLLIPTIHLKDANSPTCYNKGMAGKDKCDYCNWFKNLGKIYCLNWLTRNPMEVKE